MPLNTKPVEVFRREESTKWLVGVVVIELQVHLFSMFSVVVVANVSRQCRRILVGHSEQFLGKFTVPLPFALPVERSSVVS